MTATKKKLSAEDKAKFDQIEGLVTVPDNRRRFQAATTAAEVRGIATELEIDTRNDMGKLSAKLKQIGVNYPALRAVEREERDAEVAEKAAELAECKDSLPVVRLWSAAAESDDGSEASFALVDADGIGTWFGQFWNDDKIRKPGDLVSAEQSVAEKAIYTAFKARKAAEVDEVCLWLTTTCPDLDVPMLRSRGARNGIAVDVTVDDADNRAVAMAEATGYRSLKSVTDDEFAELVETDLEVDTDESEDAVDVDALADADEDAE